MKNLNKEKHVPSMAAFAKTVAPTKQDTKKEVEPTNLDTLTMKELLERFNKLADTLGHQQVKRFTNKASGIKRLKVLMVEHDKVSPANKTVKAAEPTKKTKKAAKKTEKVVESDKPKGRASTKRYAFGKNVNSTYIKDVVSEAFGGTLVASKVEFVDNHYWYADIKLKKGDKVAKKVRVDYLVNYHRIPRAFKVERDFLLNHTAQAYTEK